jgi:hypothetical protein
MNSTATGKIPLSSSNYAAPKPSAKGQHDVHHLQAADAAATVSVVPAGTRRRPALLMGALGKVLRLATNKSVMAADKKEPDGSQINCSVRADASLSQAEAACADDMMAAETLGTSAGSCNVAQVASSWRHTKDDQGSAAGQGPSQTEQETAAHTPSVTVNKGNEGAVACSKACSTGNVSTGGSVASRMHSVVFSNIRIQSDVSSKAAKDVLGTSKGSAAAVRGLKVRMGVASGWVPDNCSITACALFELAKGEQSSLQLSLSPCCGASIMINSLDKDEAMLFKGNI